MYLKSCFMKLIDVYTVNRRVCNVIYSILNPFVWIFSVPKSSATLRYLEVSLGNYFEMLFESKLSVMSVLLDCEK